MFPNLRAGVPHHLRLQLDHDEQCGKFLFEGPPTGILVPGSGEETRLQAFSIRSELEIEAYARGDRGLEWAGADHLAITQLGENRRTLRFRTSLEQVTGGEIQVATEPFELVNRAGQACGSRPAGLVESQFFSLERNEWTHVVVSFDDIVHRLAATDPDLAPTRFDPQAPLYVRAIPWSADGPRCNAAADGILPLVILADLSAVTNGAPPSPFPEFVLSNVNFYQSPILEAWPKYALFDQGSGLTAFPGERCFRTVQDHKVFYSPFGGFGIPHPYFDAMVVQQGVAALGQTLPKGETFCLVFGGSSSSGFLGSVGAGFTNAVTGVVDGLGNTVNLVAALYEEIKKSLVNTVADVLVELVIDCDSNCRAALNFALETGLASMGLPPSLPDFEELKDKGVEYLAAQIASETGIPPSVSAKALDIATETASKLASQKPPSGGWPSWLVEDFGFRPAYVELRLNQKLPGTNATAPFRNRISLKTSSLYLGRSVRLPRQITTDPTKVLTIPIVLWPNTVGIPSIPWKKNLNGPPANIVALHQKRHWKDRYDATPCVLVAASVIRGRDDQPWTILGEDSLVAAHLRPADPTLFPRGFSWSCN